MVYVIVFLFAIGVTVIPNNINGASNKLITRIIIIVLFGFIVFRNQEMLGFWLTNGPKTAALIPLGTIIFTPIFGTIVDKKGKAASLMMLGAFLLIIAHLSLSLGNHPMFAYVGLLSLGIAFSLVPAAMWPSVAKIVPEKRLGTAYASMFTVQNWGLGLFFWGIGALLTFVNRHDIEAIQAGDAFYDYTIPILILVLCGVVSIYLAYKLKQADKRQGFGLELPS